MSKNQLQDLLETLALYYEVPAFIPHDPISIPHQFTLKEDIEIAAFLTAIISWGQRPMILKKARLMMEIMEHAPYDFIVNHNANDLKSVSNFVYRTFQPEDFIFFLSRLQTIYKEEGGLEVFFKLHQGPQSLHQALIEFHYYFFSVPHLPRTKKHIANPEKGSVAKRLHMFLRWMIRSNHAGVDFGLWNIQASKLSIPMDVHVVRTAQRLGLIHTQSPSLKTLYDLDDALRVLNPLDPVKYDFALFGLGVNDDWEQWSKKFKLTSII